MDTQTEIQSVNARLAQHFSDDDLRFKEINEKLDSILELMSAFKMGGRGVAWIIGLLVGIGTIIVLTMQIYKN